MLQEDRQIRKHIAEQLGHAGISRILIDRFPNQASITIWTARPGIIIGKRGVNVKQLRDELTELSGKRISIDVQEVEHPELDAFLVATDVASQLERRISTGRAMKRAVANAMRSGAEGIKIMCSGRLHGSEMARTVWERDGRVPLQTLRADIDFGLAESSTSYGRIGVKVWIYKGEILPERVGTVEESVAV